MFKVEKERDDLVNLQFDGQLDAVEMAIILDQLVEATGEMENGKVLYTIKNFELPTFGALAVELGRLPSLFVMLGKLSKAAVIADESWMRTAAEWEGVLIPGLDIKAFEHGQEEQARAWLDA